MRIVIALAALALWPVVAPAASLNAVRTLPAGTVIGAEDTTVSPEGTDGLVSLAAAVGRQTRTTIYEGRPILASNLTNPVLVERNALVVITYGSEGLSISTEGRAMGRGGAGDTIRVLNIASRVMLSALVNPDGTLSVVPRQ